MSRRYGSHRKDLLCGMIIKHLIGCDREVVMVHLPDMSAEYWTELETEEVEEILKHKHKYR